MTLIIAHRGFADNCRENTKEAIHRAIEVGADAIELDVRKTKDNVFILFHDEFIKNKQIAQLTYAEINDLASNLNFQVPTLAAVLKLVQGKIKLDIELKEKSYEKEVIDLILKYLTREEFMVTSFQIQSLRKIKNNYTSIKTGIILNSQTASNFDLNSDLAAIDFLVLQIKLLKSKWLEIAQKNHKSLLVWTVNEIEIIEQLVQNENIVGIITDRSRLAVSLRNKINDSY